MKECNCDLRTKLVGDGCAICNPEQALEYAHGTIEDLKQERDELAAQVEVMRKALLEISTFPRRRMPGDIAKEALSITPSAALREIQARTLDAGKSEIDKLRIAHDPRMAVPGEQYYARASAVLRDMAAAKRKGE